MGLRSPGLRPTTQKLYGSSAILHDQHSTAARACHSKSKRSRALPKEITGAQRCPRSLLCSFTLLFSIGIEPLIKVVVVVLCCSVSTTQLLSGALANMMTSVGLCTSTTYLHRTSTAGISSLLGRTQQGATQLDTLRHSPTQFGPQIALSV
jgi:hypothetical protein